MTPANSTAVADKPGTFRTARLHPRDKNDQDVLKQVVNPSTETDLAHLR
jgi:hypothetical protein